MKVQAATSSDRVGRLHEDEQLLVDLVLQRRGRIGSGHDEPRVLGRERATVSVAEPGVEPTRIGHGAA
jgi:hypothetical protein